MTFLIQPRRSIALLALFALIHSSALFILVAEPLHWVIHLVFIPAVFASFIYSLRRYVFFIDRRSVIRCWREMDGNWCIQFRNGHVCSANLLENSFRSRYLMLLNFKVTGRRFPIVLPLAFDSASKDVFRKLRVLQSETR